MKQGGFGVRSALALVATMACAFPAIASGEVQPASQFGSGGNGAGQFSGGVSIEVGPTNGNIYVGDFAARRISQFSSDGTFIRAWGWGVDTGAAAFEKCTTASGCQAAISGSGAGQMTDASGIATASNGDLFVTEFSNNRVSQYTADGDFVRAFGWGVDTGAAAFEVCTAASTCEAGSLGNGAGQMASPNSVAVSGNDLFVTQTSGHRVNRYTVSGGAVSPAGSFGSLGTGAGGLFGPRGVAIAVNGNVLVMDRANNRLSEFQPGGTFVRSWGFGVDTGAAAFETCTTATTCQNGVPGPAAGQISDGDGGEGASGLAADAAGSIFIADDGNNRIAQYGGAPVFTRAWGFAVDTGAATFEVCTVASTCQQGAGDPGLGALANPDDVAIDPVAGRVLIVDDQADRVTTYTGATPAAPPPGPGPTDPGPTDPGPTDPGPTDPGPSDPTHDPPNNDFTFGKAKLNTKKGTASLPVTVPGAGELELEGKDVKPAAGEASKASTLNLPVKAKGDLKKKLKDKGKGKATVEVTFTPDGGVANSETTKVKLELDD